MLDSLRHLVLIAECGTFTEAARRAHITQPGLSASIKRLEAEFGAKLLHRLPRGATLTAAGEALLPRALAALAAVEEGERAVVEVLGLEAGEVRVGGGAVACTYYLPPRLAVFRQAHPGVTLRLIEAWTPEIPLVVERGELDLGIAEGRAGSPHAERFVEDPLVVVGTQAALERWSDGERALAGAPFVTFNRGASLRAAYDRAFGSDMEIWSEVTNMSTSTGFLRAGLGLGLLSRSAVTDDIKLGRLHVLNDPRTPESRTLYLHHRGLDRLTPAALALREVLLTGP